MANNSSTWKLISFMLAIAVVFCGVLALDYSQKYNDLAEEKGLGSIPPEVLTMEVKAPITNEKGEHIILKPGTSYKLVLGSQAYGIEVAECEHLNVKE